MIIIIIIITLLETLSTRQWYTPICHRMAFFWKKKRIGLQSLKREILHHVSGTLFCHVASFFSAARYHNHEQTNRRFYILHPSAHRIHIVTRSPLPLNRRCTYPGTVAWLDSGGCNTNQAENATTATVVQGNRTPHAPTSRSTECQSHITTDHGLPSGEPPGTGPAMTSGV
jgi:hypothetical protein